MTGYSRRTLLMAGAATWVAAPAAARGIAPPAAAVPTSPIDVYAKIRCSLGSELVPFWYRGTVMIALQDDFPRPILGIVGFSYTRFGREPDGSWMSALSEVGYFSDLDSGEIIEETRNPLTGNLIRPRHFASGTQRNRVRQDGVVESDRKLTPPSEFLGRIGAPLRQGPEMWVDEDLLGRVSSDVLPPTLRGSGPARLLTLGSLTTYRSLARDVEDPGLANAPCTFHLQELSSLPEWFEMGDVVGKQMWRLSGRKLRSVDEIPPSLRARINRDHPTFINDPGI